MALIHILIATIILQLSAASEIPYAALESAFVSGDASKIVSYGKEKMIITVLDKEGAYSQSQAGQVLREFFSKKPAVSFKFTFRGKETEDGTFAIGNYQAKGEAFRVTIKWKKISGEFKIESIAIEKN